MRCSGVRARPPGGFRVARARGRLAAGAAGTGVARATGYAPPLMTESAPLAAHALHAAWQTGRPLDGLPDSLRPLDVAAGYRVQRALDELLGTPVGWKIGATGEAAQQLLGVPGPFYGRLFETFVVDDGGTLPALPATMLIAEAEFAFRLGGDLPAGRAPFSRDDVLAAVAAVVPALEIPASRFVDFRALGAPLLIADAACARFVVPGPACTDWDPDALADHAVTILVNGLEAARGNGGNVLGNPCTALVWLANELAATGLSLRAGDIVMSGSCAVPNAICAGDHLEADFGTLGRVTVTLPRPPA